MAKLPQIPAITGNNTLEVLQAMKDILEIRAGQRGETDAQWLTVGGDNSQIPGCRARLSADQPIQNSVSVPVNFGITDWELGGARLVSGGAILLPRSGVYLLVGSMNWFGNVVGARYLNFAIDGINIQTWQYTDSADATGRNTSSALVRVAAGSVAQLSVFQASGGTLNLLAAPTDATSLTIQFISP